MTIAGDLGPCADERLSGLVDHTDSGRRTHTDRAAHRHRGHDLVHLGAVVSGNTHRAAGMHVARPGRECVGVA